MRLEGRVAIVTGAAQGIGEAIVRRFVRESARVVACDLNLEATEALCTELATSGHELLAQKVNVSSYADVEGMVEAALERFGQVDILINNAAICPKKLFLEYTEEDWDEIQRVNVKGGFFCVRAAAEHMKARRYGRIVNFSSSAWRYGGLAEEVPYTTSKAAVIGMTRSLARVLGPFGITVNAIAPGATVTPMTRAWLPDREKELMARIPLGRVGQPQDMANAALFLASEEAGYITGICLDVNGGIAMG